MTRTRPTPAILWAALALLAAPTLSPGQPCDVPPEIVAAASLNGQQEKQLSDCVAANIRLMESDDRTDMRKGKESLLNPLHNAQASVTFRLKYSTAAAPALERMARAENEPRAINALIVTGALGTTQAAAILEGLMQDPRVAVRYSAVASHKRMFQAIGGAPPAMPPEDAGRMVDALGRQLAAEKDPQVFDAGIRALIAAAGITRAEFSAVRRHALVTLAKTADERLRTLQIAPADDPFLQSMVRAAGVLRDAPLQQNLDADTTRLILKVGAGLWAHVARRLEAGQFPPIAPDDNEGQIEAKKAARNVPIQAVQVGQATMFIAASKLGDAAAFEPQDPVRWIAEATADGDSKFVRRARELLGPRGILTKPPFSFPPDTFFPK